MLTSTGSTASSTLTFDLAKCPLLGGGCELSLLAVATSTCYTKAMRLADGTRCGDAAVEARCVAGSCLAVGVCGDGARQPSEWCDGAEVGCTNCSRTPPPGTAGSCGDSVQQAWEECDGGACCDTSCHFRPVATSCTTGGGGSGFCQQGVCTGAPSALTAQEFRVDGQLAVADFEKCPVQGCTMRLHVALPSTDLCAPLHDPPLTLEDGVACAAEGGTRGACHQGVCVGLTVCGNGMLEAGEQCDDDSGCCDLRSCTLVASAVCSGGECCDEMCRPHNSSTLCSGGMGICVRGGRCLSASTAGELSLVLDLPREDIAFLPQECPPRDGCQLQWWNNATGSCTRVTLPPGMSDRLPADTRCVPAGAPGQQGRCSGHGRCIVIPVCGDGIVTADEECDDQSACCVSCKLAQGAACSGGECCDSATCQPQPPTTVCDTSAGSGGYCASGTCVKAAVGCTAVGQRVNTSACPIMKDRQCTVRCYVPIGSTCDTNGLSDTPHAWWPLNDLPDGTPLPPPRLLLR